mgnify:CR=1 FL=1
MRLAGFYGFTAINLMAIQDSTNVISYVQNLNSILNDQILRDLSKEFYFLGRSLDSLELELESKEAKDFYQIAPLCTIQGTEIKCPSEINYDDFCDMACSAGVLALDVAIKRGRNINLSDLNDMDLMAVKDYLLDLTIQFLSNYSQRFVADRFADSFGKLFIKHFSGNSRDVSNYSKILKACHIQQVVPKVLYQNNVKYELSDNNRKVIQFLIKRRTLIDDFLKSINVTNIVEDKIFGTPFTTLISRDPRSIFYAVRDRFSYAVGADSMLLNVLQEVKTEIAKFKSLKDEKVRHISTSCKEVEVTRDEYSKFIEKFPENKRTFFISIIENGYVVIEDISWNDLESLSNLFDLANNITLSWYNSKFGTNYSKSTFYDEIVTLNSLGLAGLNSCTFDLFKESMQSIVLSMTNVYEKSDEYFTALDNVLSVVDELLDTIISISTAL